LASRKPVTVTSIDVSLLGPWHSAWALAATGTQSAAIDVRPIKAVLVVVINPISEAGRRNLAQHPGFRSGIADHA
jgi:hypothetical protein